MTRRPLTLTLALAFSATAALTACDRVSSANEQEYIQRAKDFEDQGNHKSSIIELKNALLKNPDSVEARQLLGQVYLKSHQGAESEKELSRALKLGANREALQPALGEALMLIGEYQRVLDEIQAGDQTSPTNRARILQLRGHALIKLGKLKESCDLFEQSRMIDASIPQTYWGLALCAVAAHDMAQARSWLDEAIKLPSEKVRTHLFIADWEQLNENPKAALAAYSAVLKIEPDNLTALENRVTLNLKSGQIKAAQADTEQVEKLFPKTPPALYLRALLFFQQQNYPATRNALQEVLQVMPNHLPSILLAGATAFELGSYEQAESHLRRYLTRYPGQAYASRILAATKIKQNQPDKALETLMPLLSPNSRDVQALILAGEARRSMQDPVRASEWYARAAAIDPKNAALHIQMGLNHLSLRNFPQGLSELDAAAAMAPDRHEADNLLALAYLEQKQYDKALTAIQAMDRKLPGNPAVRVLFGQAYAGKKDYTRARKSFEEALAIDPDLFPAIASLARLDVLDKKMDVARKRFERVLSKDKNHLQAMLTMSQLAMLDKDNQTALGWLEKAATAHPQALEPRQQLIPLYFETHDYQKALNAANEALNTNPDSPVALDLLGTAQLAAGQKENALVSATKLVAKMPRVPAAYMKLAQVQLSLGKLDAARKTLNQALTIQPDSPPVQEALANLEIQAGRSEESLRIARQMQTAQPKSATGFLLEGNIQLSTKKPAEAVQAFAQAFALDHKNTSLINWHQATYQAGNTSQTDNQLMQWLKAQPADFPVRAYLAQHYMNTGRIREAIGQYETILQYASNNVLALNNLAALYQQQKDPRALTTAEKAYKRSPKDAATQDTLGWILVEQGQLKRGLALLQQATVGVPTSATIRYHYAFALVRAGEPTQARKILRELLASRPKFPESEEAKALLLRL